MSTIMRKTVDNVNHMEIDGRAAPDVSVLELVHAVMHRFRARQYRTSDGAPSALTHMESKVLGFFASHPGATQSDLSQHSGRDKAQLARLVKGLRERGLLDAEADDADRRNLRLRLTETGRAVQRDLRRRGQRLEAEAVAGLSDDERTRLATLLERVRRNLGGER